MTDTHEALRTYQTLLVRASEHTFVVVMVVLLLGIAACKKPADPPSPELRFRTLCARCHGPGGEGGQSTGGVAPRDFTDPAWQDARNDEEIGEMIRHGKSPHMPGFAKVLTDDEVDGLVEHIRQLRKEKP